MSIKYDSRKVKSSDTFVAIPGTKQDGAKFIPQAIKNGAKIIVAEKKVNVPAGVKLKVVKNARQEMAKLACKMFRNPSKKLKLIGVTGTNGKTSITYLIKSILETAGFKVGLIGTINSSLTTPESVDLQQQLAEMVKQGVTHCVIEVSSHALDQDRVHALDFDIAIFTNLTHEHLDYHKSMDNYFKAKLKLFEMLSSNGIAIINIDDPYAPKIMEKVKGEVVTYGLIEAKHELRSTKHSEFDAVVSNVLIKEDEMHIRINSFEVKTPLIGTHNVYNIAAAFQCGLGLNLPQSVIVKGIEALKSIPGRGERIGNVIIDFAHTPDALQKLIETYRALTEGKIILVFGCPGDRDKEKRPIMGKISAELADQTIITTDDPHSEDPKKIIDRKKAIQEALKIVKKNDIVLIAGRGHEKFQDFNGKKIEIDDREVVRSLITR